ncbi:Dihydroorotase [Anatilimnocola aggregata]|uniref:Dihydroorotase n=2 Tax=Anatilimnocola aggregata TaxID=2528021 RepID=A0A517Y8B5_9BACT|nr:Dihydroorotase [Anatilimnocola aggregata]
MLIRHAQVVLPTETIATSVLVENGKIAAVDAAIHTQADEIIDAAGLHLIPGVVDDQVHFREPGLTHKEDLTTATRACAKGGVTTFLEMPNTNPTTTSVAALHDKLALAANKCLVNYGFYIGATTSNVSELKAARRTPGIKIFIGSSTGNMLVDEQAALEAIFAETSLPICAHCEDETTVRANSAKFADTHDVADHSRIRDHQAAVIATRRAIELAHRHGHRFHVLHVSTADEVPLLVDHRGLITAEVCPHHLFFNVDDYARLGTLVQMNPSLKTSADCRGLWQALQDGLIQVIATDHAPHTLEEKKLPYSPGHGGSPSGLPAVENSLALLLNQVNQGRCTLQQVVHWMCDAPARVWDIMNKGRIEPGYDADLVLVDLNKTATIRNEEQETKNRWSPWHGETLTGWPVRTWVMGQEVFRADSSGSRINSQVRGQEATFDHARGGYWSTTSP